MTQVRGVTPDDWPWVLALNQANQTETSPLSAGDLARMSRGTYLMTAIGEEAFLIVFDQDSNYDSPNFRWFHERYQRFVYVDRVVVAPGARRKGYAKALYEHLIDEMLFTPDDDLIACEVNADPPNPVSDAFHAKLGFKQVGEAKLANGKTVRYLMHEVKPTP